MSEFLEIIQHKKRLAARLRSLTSVEIAEIAEKVNAIYEERVEEEKQAEMEAEAKQEKIKELKEKAAELGISFEDILPEATSKSKTRTYRKLPPKYKITLPSGKTKTWTGQGRMPNALKEAIEAGDSLEDYLIDKTQ